MILRSLALVAMCMFGLAELRAQEQPLPCVIRGRVWDVDDSIEEQFLQKIEKASNEAEFLEALRATTRPACRPAVGAIVTARGEHLTQTTKTDESGRYRMRVLVEVYEVTANMPGTQAASASAQVYSDRGRQTDLQLRNDIVTIKGKVTDAEGRPIAGAKVLGEEDCYTETTEIIPDRVTTTTGADGTYELKGFDPPHLWSMGGYLNGGTGGDSFNVGVVASAPGTKKQSVVVPLVTESRLPVARRFYQAMRLMAKRAGSKQEWREKEGLRLPMSQGNTILGVDIVLKAQHNAD